MSASRNVILAASGLALLGVVAFLFRAPPPPGSQLTVLVPPTVMHGVQGLAFDKNGLMYGASFFGQSIYTIDTATGQVGVKVGPPEGEGDDIAIGPEGTPAAGIIAWTGAGSVQSLTPDGVHHPLVEKAPRPNPIAFNKEGRLFYGGNDAKEYQVWELDPLRVKEARIVAKGPGRLNGFDFGPDGLLYTPLFETDRIASIDINTGKTTVIAKGVGSPSALKVDSQGNLIAVDYKLGDVWHITRTTGEVRKLINLPPVIDNLAIGKDGTIYLASTADSIVWALNPATGAARKLVAGIFNTPLGMSYITRGGKPTLLVAMPQSYTFYDLATGVPSRPFYGEQLQSSNAVAADERIVVTAVGTGRLRKIDRVSGELIAESRDVKAPSGVAITPNGGVFVVDTAGGRLLRWTDSGMETVVEGMSEPTAIAVEAQNSVLIAETGAGVISRVDVITKVRNPVARGFDRPQGIAQLTDGRIAVAEPATGKVIAVDAGGERSELASGLNLSVDKLRIPKTTPVGMAVGPDGALYVAVAGDNSLVKIGFGKAKP